jgi:hypothetical protein
MDGLERPGPEWQAAANVPESGTGATIPGGSDNLLKKGNIPCTVVRYILVAKSGLC